MMCLPALAAAIAISGCELFGVAMSTTSMLGSSITLRQSLEEFSKPKRAAASRAKSSLTSTTVLRTGMAGAGQKNIGMAAYASECALPMKPAPIRATLSFCMVNLQSE